MILQGFRQKYNLLTLRQLRLWMTQELGVSCLDNLSDLYGQAWEETDFELVLVPVGLRPHGPEKTTLLSSRETNEWIILTGENKIQ